MNSLHRWLCRSGPWKRALQNRIVPWVVEGIHLGDHVLEVGPGPGVTTDLLRRSVARMTAIEVDTGLARLLASRLRGSNVQVTIGDASDMPFEDRSFSAVVSLTMLHHVSTRALQDRLLAEAYRVLRPGGVIAGTDNIGGLGFRLLHIGDTMVLVDPESFPSRLADAGFRDAVVDITKGRFRFRAVRAE